MKKNQPTTVEITKSDVTTGVELDGAKLTVLDKEGNVVDQWISVKDQPHVIKRLTVGEEYTLREEMAPYGYLKATDVKFTLEDRAEIQKVEMKDEVPTGLLIINKNGEFLDKVTLLDNVKGTVEHLFEYVTGSLTDVTFDVFAAEDIKAADGVSEDYFKADEKVGTITTDSNGIAQMDNLPAGKYYVKEVKTAHGYVLDGEPRYVDLSYRDQDTPVITYDEKWQNARQKVKVTVVKKEKDTDRVLAGGVFGLYTSEDIKNAKGEVLLEKDSLIEQRVTDEKGQITFTADLPVDGKYYVKEIFAPDGFVTTEEVQEFTFEYAGEDQAGHGLLHAAPLQKSLQSMDQMARTLSLYLWGYMYIIPIGVCLSRKSAAVFRQNTLRHTDSSCKMTTKQEGENRNATAALPDRRPAHSGPPVR